MKTGVLILVGALMVGSVGCSSLKNSIPFLGGVKNQIESIVAVTVGGTYTVNVVKDGQVIVSETWECVQENGKLAGCHKK